MSEQANEIKLWGMFHGCAHGLYTAERVDKATVVFKVADSSYIIQLSEKADGHTALIGFDGFLLRHGLAGGTKVLTYQFSKKGTEAPGPGPEDVEMSTEPGNVRHESDYEGVLRDPVDYLVTGGADPRAYALHRKSQRHFLALPITREGSRSLVCQLKPRSLQRRYIMFVATLEEVRFITCNSY